MKYDHIRILHNCYINLEPTYMKKLHILAHIFCSINSHTFTACTEIRKRIFKICFNYQFKKKNNNNNVTSKNNLLILIKKMRTNPANFPNMHFITTLRKKYCANCISLFPNPQPQWFSTNDKFTDQSYVTK